MSARRCSRCALYWPSSSDYVHCPECLEETDYFASAAPMKDSEAKRRTAWAKHERHYSIREARRRAEGYPTPEELGEQEAREIMELERAYKLEVESETPSP